jgi:NAD dependent epimerase/dehydratase family enzyme
MNDVCVNSAEAASSRAGNTALRIVIPGGEGHLGRILTRYLRGTGLRLTTFTRNPCRVAGSSDAPGQRTAIHRNRRNLVPVPLPNQLSLSELQAASGMRFGLPAREWMLELGAFFLRTETELLLKSQRVSSAVLSDHGFQFLFPEWPEAVRGWLSRRRKNTEQGREPGEK